MAKINQFQISFLRGHIILLTDVSLLTTDANLVMLNGFVLFQNLLDCQLSETPNRLRTVFDAEVLLGGEVEESRNRLEEPVLTLGNVLDWHNRAATIGGTEVYMMTYDPLTIITHL